MSTNELEMLMSTAMQAKQDEKATRARKGRKLEEIAAQRAKEFLAKVSFLNKYGIELHLSVEPETGCTSYPGESNILIRSSRHMGFIQFTAARDYDMDYTGRVSIRLCYLGTAADNRILDEQDPEQGYVRAVIANLK